MLRRMPGRTWKYWQAFFRMAPFGPLQDAAYWGKLLTAIYARGGQSTRPEDHFPQLYKPLTRKQRELQRRIAQIEAKHRAAASEQEQQGL